MKPAKIPDIYQQCEWCGSPFDIHAAAYDMGDNGDGPWACSKKCAEELLDYQGLLQQSATQETA